MKQSNGSNLTSQTQNVLSSASNILKQKRTLWLAGMLTFFIPSIAAGAWYAGSTNMTGQADQAQASGAGAYSTTPEASASSSEQGASASAGNAASSAGDNTDSQSQPSAQVYINGEKVVVPPSGNLSQTTTNSDGTTSHVDVSVNSNQNSVSTSTNGTTNTHTYMHSNSSTITNNNGTNTNVTNFTNVP